MEYTTATEVKKRYDWLIEDEFSDDRINIAIYDATQYIDAKLRGTIPILPLTLESQLVDYPILETICIQLTVCFIIREQDVRKDENKTQEQSYAFESATCGAANDLIDAIQKGNATIGQVTDPDTNSDTESRGQFFINTGLDVFGLHE